MTCTKLFILGLLVGSPTAALAQDYSGSVVGSNGGSAVYSGSCTAGEAAINCTQDSHLTGPKGYTATRKLDREITETGVKTKITTTGALGRTTITTRERMR